jgi:hypothetical protein
MSLFLLVLVLVLVLVRVLVLCCWCWFCCHAISPSTGPRADHRSPPAALLLAGAAVAAPWAAFKITEGNDKCTHG